MGCIGPLYVFGALFVRYVLVPLAVIGALVFAIVWCARAL